MILISKISHFSKHQLKSRYKIKMRISRVT